MTVSLPLLGLYQESRLDKCSFLSCVSRTSPTCLIRFSVFISHVVFRGFFVKKKSKHTLLCLLITTLKRGTYPLLVHSDVGEIWVEKKTLRIDVDGRLKFAFVANPPFWID